MKRERKYVIERQTQILAYLKRYQKAEVDQLVELCQASAMTIRRDLQNLEEQGLIKRFYGGAAILEHGRKSTMEAELMHCRREIARYAASLVEEGDTIFINGSSTALLLTEELGDKRVRVITNNLDAIRSPHSENTGFALTGGNIADNDRVLVGDLAISNLLQVKAEKAFLGFAGISENGEVICDVIQEIGVHQIMMSHSKSFYLLLDHEKLGNLAEGASCTMETGGELITDQKADPQILDKLRKKGMKITIVNVE